MRNADLDGARPRAPDLARRHVAQHAPANAPAPRSPDSKFPIACNRQLDASLSRPQCVRSPELGVAELSSRRPTPASASPASCQWHSRWQVQLLAADPPHRTAGRCRSCICTSLAGGPTAQQMHSAAGALQVSCGGTWTAHVPSCRIRTLDARPAQRQLARGDPSAGMSSLDCPPRHVPTPSLPRHPCLRASRCPSAARTVTRPARGLLASHPRG